MVLMHYYREKFGITMNIDTRLKRAYREIQKYIEENAEQIKIFNLQLVKYHQMHKQTEQSKQNKKKIWLKLARMIECIYPQGYLAMGGSTVNGCGLKSSDLDLCFGIKRAMIIVDENIEECGEFHYLEYEEEDYNRVYTILDQIYDYFKENFEEEFVPDSLELIYARVPVIKLRLVSDPNVEVDINVNCTAGIYNSHLLNYYSKIDNRLSILAAFLKKYLDERNVIKPREGRLNSYTVVLMIIHYFQCGVDPPILPNLNFLYAAYFDGSTPLDLLKFDSDFPTPFPEMPKNNMSLTELLLGFFYYYANFDYAYDAISIKDGMVFSRYLLPHHTSRFRFFIEEVYDGMTVPKNLTKQSDLNDIIRIYKDSVNRLLHFNYDPTIDLFIQSLTEDEIRAINNEIDHEGSLIDI